jgi:hypothetical protein
MIEVELKKECVEAYAPRASFLPSSLRRIEQNAFREKNGSC